MSVKDMDGIGPRTVTKAVCFGCPALATKYWSEMMENDDLDSGTSATCTEAWRHISSYWIESDRAPDWCPAMLAARTTGEKE